MRLEHETLTVHTRTPFVIARGGATEWRRVWVRVIDDDGAEGWGEAAPSRFYGETTASVIAALEVLGAVVAGASAWSLEAVEAEMHKALRLNASAKSAVSAALHDLADALLAYLIGVGSSGETRSAWFARRGGGAAATPL